MSIMVGSPSAPIGTPPKLGIRIVNQAFDKGWGPHPMLKHKQGHLVCGCGRRSPFFIDGKLTGDRTALLREAHRSQGLNGSSQADSGEEHPAAPIYQRIDASLQTIEADLIQLSASVGETANAA
jgi:hypothetical protein